MKRFAPIAGTLMSVLFYVVVFAQDIEGTVNKGANLRSGPGTTFAIVGKATQGQAVTIADKNAAGDWYQLDTGEWIAAFLVTLDAESSVTATPTAKAIPTKQVTTVDILNDPVAQAYVADMQQAIDYFVDGSDMISERFKEAGENTSVMFTDKWIISVGVGLAGLQMSSEAFRALEPPSYFADMHEDMLVLADHIDSAIPLLTEGIDGFDADKLKAGSSEYLLAVNSMKSAQVKLEALIAAAEAAPTPTTTPTPRPTATKTPVPTATRKG